MSRLPCIVILIGVITTSITAFSKEVAGSFTGQPFSTAQQDTLIRSDNESYDMIAKYADPASANYKKAFADIIHRVDTCKQVFYILYVPQEGKGSFSYDGTLRIIITDPGPIYGAKDGRDAFLFEEIKHVEQFLDGKAFFQKINGKWEAVSNLHLEVEAKLFAANTLDILQYWPYTDSTGKTESVTSILWHLKNNLRTENERCDFLQKGGKVPVSRMNVFVTAAAYVQPAYPEGTTDLIKNFSNNIIKDDNLFCYPRKAHAGFY